MNRALPLSLRERRKLASRAAILDAAKELFLVRGYAATTLRDIAARAGVSPGLVFLHVSDKQELLRLVLHEDIARILAREAPAIMGAQNVPDLLAGLARSFLDYYGRHRELSRALIGSTLFRPSAYGEQLMQLRDLLADKLARTCPQSDAEDRVVAAELLVSRYLSCVIAFLGDEQSDADAQIAKLTGAANLVVSGLRAARHD